MLKHVTCSASNFCLLSDGGFAQQFVTLYRLLYVTIDLRLPFRPITLAPIPQQYGYRLTTLFYNRPTNTYADR